MRKAATVAIYCLLILYGALAASGQVSRISSPGGFVPEFDNAKIVSRNPDGSVTFDDGATIYPDGSITREIGGHVFVKMPGDPQVHDLGPVTPPTSVIMKKDPETGVERYYRVGPDNKAVEIKFPAEAASK